MNNAMPMPEYMCHKRVWALKIKAVINAPPGCDAGVMAFETEESGYAPVTLSAEYMAKHKPEPGGYYVVYADGYRSYSPAKAFEEGYTAV